MTRFKIVDAAINAQTRTDLRYVTSKILNLIKKFNNIFNVLVCSCWTQIVLVWRQWYDDNKGTRYKFLIFGCKFAVFKSPTVRERCCCCDCVGASSWLRAA